MLPLKLEWVGDGFSFAPIEEPKNITVEVAHWDNNNTYKRRIVSAANRYKLNNGKILVIPCVRHYSKEHHPILDTLISAGLLDKNNMARGDNQGFIDQYSNYWTREEALYIATENGQLEGRKKSGSADELYSEDLY
ncbi:hypothetical protein AVV36_gp169 [Pectobacterium bacteriophage PM2]|uniref:Uncharacterized protein n=1 Tax=Pectobacterium bacteriophage PM2 TaxID=1429794 RepID=A0A0A0Q0S5_9CAUD|nr:hypothetical protein AVV36_gp169 [Pectobacterium bacteriophage PM2]AHY25241.1 hypothetical protein PM2_279 [Pectobacterium bacteriophage PM2]